MIAPNLRDEPTPEQEANRPNARALIPFYDDGPGEPNCPDCERAFRQGFVEEARIVRDWVDPNADTDLFGEEEAAQKLRRRVRERFTLYGFGEAGRKTHHLGYRTGHEVPAARQWGQWKQYDYDVFGRLIKKRVDHNGDGNFDQAEECQFIPFPSNPLE